MGFSLEAPRSVGEALELLRPGTGRTSLVLAGGTDLLRDLDDGRTRADQVVSLRNLPWNGLAWSDGGVTIGSTRSLRALELDPAIASRLPGLWEAIRAVGGVALRHRATLGGNVARASPASDLIPILLAYDAEVALQGPSGPRRLALSEVVVGARKTALAPGELIESLRLPCDGPSTYLWQRVRPANDISQVGLAVAFAGSPPTWRVALGGAPPRPVRLPNVERLLGSDRPTAAQREQAAALAATEAPFASDKRATESYRRHLVRVLLERALVQVAGTGGSA